MNRIISIILFLLITNVMFSQGTCNTALPFCTGTNYTFPASTNTPAPTGAYFDCLWTQPNPAFYYMEIDNPGNMTINIQGMGAGGGTNDIDFICWGPFVNPTTMCNQLTAANVEDCSYSPTWNEFCQINGASNGDYYVLLITNYSNQPCNITFSQTSGNATTNCCILGGDAGDDNNIDVCDTDSPFSMWNQLLGTPDIGGVWYNSGNTVVSANFDPAITPSGVYSYIVPGSSSSCPDDTAYLSINVNVSPTVNLPPFLDVCDNDNPLTFNTGTPIGGTYTINGSNATIFTPSPLNIGNSTIMYNYTDLNGCSGTSTQNIIVHESPFATATTANASCNGYTDGSAMLNISNGTSPYTENWGTYNPTSLAAGTYGYTITDANGCVFSDSIVIYEPGPFNINVLTTNVNCNGQNDGTAVVKINGSSAPAGTVSTLSYCGSTPGSSFSSTIDYVQLTGDISNIDNNTAGLCDQYEDHTNLYADITEGQTYTINVTLGDCSSNNYPSGGKVYIDWNIDGDFDDPGEEVGIIPYGVGSTIAIPITVPYSGAYGATRMRVVSQFLNNTPVSSIGPCDVGIMANPIYVQPWFGATEDYSIVVNPGSISATYIWSSGQTTDSVSNLASGMYSVDVIDQNGCITTGFFSITEPSAITVIETQNNITCHGGSDGGITLDISGGITNYIVNIAGFFQMLNGGITTYSTPTTLAAGIYPYTITDSNNCTYTDNITLTSPNDISVIETISNVSCYGFNDGTVSLNISGGIPGYTQNWGGNNTTALSSGIYNYMITDNNGCNMSDSIIITEPIEISLVSTHNNVSTCGASDGNINISTSGGTTPYSFNWNNGSNSEDINNLTAGIYTLTVTDANGCLEIITITITEPISPIINYTQINTSCNGSSDGSIDITVTGGLGPYQYIWSNSASSEDINNLVAGIYTVNITDGNNCNVSENITITEPNEITITTIQTNTTNCNGNDGSIDISTSGGIGTYTYLWSNNATTEDISGLTSGTYSVDITDANSCIYSFNFTINDPSGITATEIISNVDCFGGNTGSVILNVNGGQSPFIENWNGYNSLSLSAGTYTYTVTDNLNCSFSNTITITEPQELMTNPTINNVLCKDENSGSAILNIIGGTAPFNENWGTFNANALYAGTYNYTVIDNNGCAFSNSITITEPLLLLSTLTTTDALCFGYSDGTAIVNTTGGITPYIVDWFGENNLSLNAGNYSILITDANGCTNTLSFSINEPSDISVVIDSFPATCFGYPDGSALLTISGGNPPFTENWNGQNPLALSAGNHSFTITDSNNCIQQGIATIYEPNEISTNEIISDVLCYGEENGTAFLQITGGTSPYSEDWNGINILQLSSGSYSYTITDANNCIFTDYVVINEPNIIMVTENITDANCFNSNDGQAILMISGGIPPYNQDWGIENPFALSAGIYDYTITDANSCSYSDSIIINQSNQVFMSFNMESPICIYDSSIISISVLNPLSSYYTIEINNGTNSSYLLVDSLGNNFANGNPIFFTPLSNTLFTVISITDENGCNSSINQTDSIIVNSLPILTLDIPNFCTQDSSITINQGSPSGGTYFIEGIQTSFFDIEQLQVETYSIQYNYTDPITTCFNSITTSVQINESPTANFEFGPNPINIDNPIVEFINRSYNYNSSIWTLSDGNTVIGEDQFTHVFSDIGNYIAKLYVENSQGCSDSINYNIIINPVFSIYIPSAFSPNNNGNNDSFGPILREGGYTSYSMQIFNQWGEIIFDEKDLFWDGKLNGKLCQNGTYSYTIIAYDFLEKPHSRTGSFILLR